MERDELHRRNRHNGQYDFTKLIEAYPPLEKFVTLNKYSNLSIDFFNPTAVKALNKSLLLCYYGITDWDIPTNSLCPPIPGRADYIHYIADLIAPISWDRKITCLDIGVGSNCIFPIIGIAEYGWRFVATDISNQAITNANKIVANNNILKDNVELRLQSDSHSIFRGVIQPQDFFDITICNPPFHNSMQSAERGTRRKLSNLKKRHIDKAILNFGGRDNELWCEGGELRFVTDMIKQSREYSTQCGWFTTLISKEDNLEKLYHELKAAKIAEYRTIPMRQGNKISRILAWK